MKIEFLYFPGYASHEPARALLVQALAEAGVTQEFANTNASDPAIARRLHFPGSPTIRMDGQDIEPSFQDPGDYTPRCRLYATPNGLRGVPERSWIGGAIRRGLSSVGE